MTLKDFFEEAEDKPIVGIPFVVVSIAIILTFVIGFFRLLEHWLCGC